MSTPFWPARYALGAILLWATQAVILAETLPKLNILLFLTIAFCFSTLLLLYRVRKRVKHGIKSFHQLNKNKVVTLTFKRISFYIKLPYIIPAILAYFSYHLFLFYAIKKGPVISANLLNYLWPLFFVLVVTCLPRIFPKEKRGFFETSLLSIKLLLGVSGALLLLTKGNMGDFKVLTIFQTQQGPLIGLAAAIMWAMFSVLLKHSEVKLEDGEVELSWVIYPFMATIMSFCLLNLSGHLSSLKWLDLGLTILPAAYFGIGPLGFAMVWYDKAIHLIDAKQLGQLIFLTPLLSTLLLIIFSKSIELNFVVIVGCALIIIVNMRIIETIKSIMKLFKRRSSKMLHSRVG